MARTYADAVASLNTLQTNFAIIDAIRKSGRKMNLQAIPEMVEWCKKIGHNPSEFDQLNAVHIAGTKGKGSTAAFVSSILSQHIGRSSQGNGKTLAKVGLYTSPHLRFARERIQINGQPLSEEQFAKYFFEVWDRLEKAAEAAGQDPKGAGSKPVYFRYLTLMAFHTYLSEGVDAAVFECGIGGAYDATNVIQNPTVTGITSLGIDHVGILGETLPEIAWHKAGIIKSGVKCFTPDSQKSEAKAVLEKVAQDQNSELIYTSIDPEIQSGSIHLGLQAEFQKTNASLAKAIAKEWLAKTATPTDEETIIKGLEQTRWAGRCETRHEKNIIWCIDGGHTLDSIELAGQWFASVLQSQTQTQTQSKPSPSGSETTPSPRVLIFNQQTRDASALASALHSTLSSALSTSSPFTHAIFCTNTTYTSTGFRPDLVSLNTNASDVSELTVQKQLAKTWGEIDADATVQVVKTIEEAVEVVRGMVSGADAGSTGEKEREIVALVTGSLHLVGGFLEVFESGGRRD